MVFSKESKSQIQHFYYCTNCKTVVYNAANEGNTNKLLRHVCFGDINIPNTSKKKNLIISEAEKEVLKRASALFVAKDIRPAGAIEGEGLFELCCTCMEFGQRNRKATRNDLSNAFPSRNTVTSTVGKIATDCRRKTAAFIQRAIAKGGVAATTDCWTDDYRHITYISVVAHLSIRKNDDITYHRFVLSTNEISELIKTGS